MFKNFVSKECVETSTRLQKLIVFVGSIITFMIMTYGTCFAGPGGNLQKWVTNEGKGVFAAILVIAAIILFVKRQVIAAVIVFVFAGVCGWAIYDTAGFIGFWQGIIQGIFN